MSPADEYIKSLGSNYIFSEILTQPSAAGVAFADWNNRGAVFILVHAINLSVIAGAAIFTIVDPFNRVMLQLDSQAVATGQYIFPPYIYKGGVLRISSSIPANTTFTVTYQFMAVKGETKR